jgi:WD40 repeat protein
VAERRALLIGVSGFAEADDTSPADLSFAAPAIEDLSVVLRDGFGYSVTALTEPGMTTVQLGAAVRQAFTSASKDDILLIHLLTHGVARTSLLYALGCDEAVDETAEVGGWLAGVQNVPDRPLTLVTLDMCYSGTVTQLPWEAGDGNGRRGWVIVACEADRQAFDGRFTRAFTTVLSELARGDIPVSPDASFVPLQTVARVIRSTVTTTAQSADSFQQLVVSSRLDMADTFAAPFFPVPRVAADPAEADLGVTGGTGAPPEAAPGLLPYLADADFGSLVQSAAGSAVISDLAGQVTGCFSGRKQELRALSGWLDRAAGGPLAVVTGGPGAGKSALLGLLVCAAHPVLRGPATPIWEATPDAPGPVSRLCAVDASQRDLEAVAQALGRQLELGGDVVPNSVLTALAERSGPVPVFVVDSLDEADDAGEIASWLIRLASLRREDGSAAVRLLVGTRGYDESAALRALARETHGQLHDLDAVPPAVLEDDLQRYVTSLLRSIPSYHQAYQVTGAFAGKLAETLTSGDRAGRSWGEFLVAGLFTRRFVDVFQLADGAGAAERLAGTAPRSLAGVLDLDFDRHRDDLWLRPVLSAVAHARGSGMPASVIRRVAGALTSRRPGTAAVPAEPSLAEVTTALRTARSYLRRSVDGEKLAVYRLFHEGLGDRLRRPEDAARVYRALLAVTGPAGRRIWSAAEPYVFEHALDYAEDLAGLLDDPGFLVYARRDSYLARFGGRAALLLEDTDPADSIMARRAVMARAAVESGQSDVASYLAEMPGEPPLPWLPLWAVGVSGSLQPAAAIVPAALDVRSGLRVWSQGPDSARPESYPDVSAFALARQNDQLAVVAGDTHGAVVIIEPGRNLIPLAAHDAGVAALAVATYGQDQVVVSGSQDGTVQAHSLSTRQRVREPVHLGAEVSTLAVGGDPRDPVVACVTGPGGLWTWRIGPGQHSAPYRWTLQSPARSVSVTMLRDQPVVLVGSEDGNARSLDCQAHALLKTLGGHGGPVLAVTAETVAGRAVAVTGSPTGYVHTWDLLGGRETGPPVKVCSGPVAALALRATPTRLLCLAGGRGVSGTALWDLSEGRRQHDFGRNGAASVALSVGRPTGADGQGRRHPSAVGILTQADGSAMAVIGDHDGGITGVEFDSGQVVAVTLAASDDPVTSIEVTYLAGIPTAVIGSDQAIRLWQPPRSTVVTVSADAGRAGSRLSPWRDSAIADGKLLTVGRSQDGRLTVDGDPVPGADGVTAWAVTQLDGSAVALTGDQAGRVRIWDLVTRQKSGELNVGEPVFGLAATADGRLAVGADGHVYGFRRHGYGPERFTGRPPEA